ncbi:phage tail protein [Pandoraea apista]|uniref:Phage tail protein n=1 Tax=Pandoraea apista TaxID=93218 RepID=A0ABX9ZLC4_9BURK|nr:phage tail protein [Pandoraea apista]RSK77852.1 phage tail protein [Pandoraea apista]RUN81840.1 phage tail protein [Pandoraea apista]
MTDTFIWSPRADASGDTTFAVRKAQFGDGYEQRVADGLNNQRSSYQLTFVGDAAKISAILAFLDAHAGAKSFFWTPSLRPQALFVCEKYSDPVKDGSIYTISATFDQTFAP